MCTDHSFRIFLLICLTCVAFILFFLALQSFFGTNDVSSKETYLRNRNGQFPAFLRLHNITPLYSVSDGWPPPPPISLPPPLSSALELIWFSKMAGIYSHLKELISFNSYKSCTYNQEQFSAQSRVVITWFTTSILKHEIIRR